MARNESYDFLFRTVYCKPLEKAVPIEESNFAHDNGSNDIAKVEDTVTVIQEVPVYITSEQEYNNIAPLLDS